MSQINLLPQREKQIIKNEYRTRLFIVGIVVFSFVLLMGALMMVPAYMHVRSERILGEARLVSLDGSSSTEDDHIDEEIDKTNHEMVALTTLLTANKSADIFEEVINARPTGIVITGLYKEKKETSDDTITVAGTAKDRTILLEFADALKANSSFKEVKVPISNFASSKDIPFTISFVIHHAQE